MEIIQYRVGETLETYTQCSSCGDQYMLCAVHRSPNYTTFASFIDKKLSAAPDWIDPMAAELEQLIKEVEHHDRNNSA